MPDLLFDRERAALGELWRLIEERRAGEDDVAVGAARAEELAVDAGEKARQALAKNQERELAELDAAAQKEQEELTERFAGEEAAAQRFLADSRRHLEAEEKNGRARVDGALKDALWMADSVSEGERKHLQEQLDAVRNKVASAEERSDALWAEIEPLLDRVDLEREDIEPEEKVPQPQGERPSDHEAPLHRADALVHRIRQLATLRWMSWTHTVGIGLAVAAAGSLSALWLRPRFLGFLAGGLAGLLVALLIRKILYGMARRRVGEMGDAFAILLAQTHSLGTEFMRETEARVAQQRVEVNNKHAAERRQARAAHGPRLEELLERVRRRRNALEQKFETSTEARRQEARQTLETAQQRQQEARAQCLARHEQERQDAEAAYAERMGNLAQARADKAQQVRERWELGAGRLLSTFAELQQAAAGFGVRRLDTALDSAGSSDSEPSQAGAPRGPELPFGTLTVNVHQLAGDLPVEKLAPLPSQPINLPVFLPFPRLGGLLLHAFAEGRTVAVQALQALMLRFLTALPPGKVRFTILDPVGLGENFAAFMHLADHDESLVSSRIWTEPAHIEKQLADLTVHMENVIQKYLRSQFSSIEDYNAEAGEVAEPYRVLVIANFPINFTPQAARRLVSIVQSGSSCGVYALIGLDTRQAVPPDFQIDDLEQLCLNLYWRNAAFQWSDEELLRYPLTLAMPPETSEVIETVRRVGALSRDANRVRVPFSFIAPAEDQVWKADSRCGISVPLGRSGAVRRLSLQLGQGTSQHVLVAGKTGSGKSTLWHALITNLSLMYNPDEVELYLIDFKKGVEFKAYAQHQLAHARVIAIESEREFGLSVLQRLNAELRQRGDLFRAAGVNDISSYRDMAPGAGEDRAAPSVTRGLSDRPVTPGHCPRILLIVDEFQEFFTEDDRLSQEAALLLDRLVRQGRAFGLHVLLGSQTLGGAYSLTRSTIDQIAVRIALQCSETDAQLILHKDNSVARLLSRPGEAIYNDTNGSIEGNEVFQVVWLPEEERERILDTVRRRAVEQLPGAAARPPLVFEGNTPAELEHNPLLTDLLNQSDGQTPARGDLAPMRGVGIAWLGEAIAIKDPTAAVFRPQTSNNLLIVGQNEEAARALLIASLVSLAAQQPAAHFVALDGTAPHEPHFGYLKTAVAGWHQPAVFAERDGLVAALAELAEEMNRRLKGAGSDRGPYYLLINGLQRYRELRRADDDLGFARRGAERTVNPLEHLQALLRDGPAVGIHLLIWCDSLANVMRSVDRPGLRECGQRVLFQMSPADSSHLLDSPLASRLGRNRALYHTDELAQPEKFRPYGLPSPGFLAEVKRRLANAGAGEVG
jgi:DNA segregation ATPase FtsK/SpoIIIE-like protein